VGSSASTDRFGEPGLVVPVVQFQLQFSRVSIDNFIECPITKHVMDDPVLCDDGHCYERVAIQRWLQTSQLSPVTRLPIRGTLTRDLAMKAIIDARRA
jgi:hypothetical protein